MEDIVPESERILARPQCTHCALCVMHKLKAYLTEAEWSHLDDRGYWHHRRQRRKQHWGISHTSCLLPKLAATCYTPYLESKGLKRKRTRPAKTGLSCREVVASTHRT